MSSDMKRKWPDMIFVAPSTIPGESPKSGRFRGRAQDGPTNVLGVARRAPQFQGDSAESSSNRERLIGMEVLLGEPGSRTPADPGVSRFAMKIDIAHLFMFARLTNMRRDMTLSTDGTRTARRIPHLDRLVRF